MQASFSLARRPAWATRDAPAAPRRRVPPPAAPSLRRPPPISAAAPAAAAAAVLKHQRTAHSMPPEKVEVFRSLEGWAAQNVLPLLKPVEQCWQPQEFVPDSSLPTDEFTDRVAQLRERTAELPDEYFVVLVGDMITEDALPTYQTMINTLDGVRDETGASPCPWAAWTRAWTAEENRHGDLLRAYLYLSGRVDMLMIERTVQYLIGSGMVRIYARWLQHARTGQVWSRFDIADRGKLNDKTMYISCIYVLIC